MIHHHKGAKTSPLRHFSNFLSPIFSGFFIMLVVPSKGKKKQPSTSLKTTDIFHLDNSVLSILNKRRSLSFWRWIKHYKNMYTMWYGFHPSTTKIYCVRCWHSQKQWSLSKQPLKWTKKKNLICFLAL